MRNRNRNWSNRFKQKFSSVTLDDRNIRLSASSSEEQVAVNKNDPNNQLGAYPDTSRPDQLAYNTQDPYKGVSVRNLPRHLYRPFNAESVDLRNLQSIAIGENSLIMSFTCPPGVSVTFLGYGVFSDALLESDIEFLPKVNGKRIFPYHGNPNNNFKIGLGLSPDLGNEALIGCYLVLRPKDVLTWNIINNASVEINAGVRMSGFLDASNLQIDQKFGG